MAYSGRALVLICAGIAACAHGGARSGSARTAVASMNPTAGHAAHGRVTFAEVDGGLRVVGRIEGLTPGAHGFHVHERGDCSAPDASSAGGHFNPGGHPHGLPDAESARHTGDLGNLTADENGVATLDRVFSGRALDGPAGVIGRGLIVHESPDDGSQPSGNAGARVACGVVQAAHQ